MSQKFPIGTWIYNPVYEFTASEVDVWDKCGLTYTFSPKVTYGKDDVLSLIPYLDSALKKNMKLIAYVVDIPYDGYEEAFASVVDKIGSHPALAGFFVMDEPSDAEQFEIAARMYSIQKKVAPRLEPFINFMGSTHERHEVLEGRDFSDLIADFKKKTGCERFAFDAYSQLINNDVAVNGFFVDVKHNVEAAEANGIEPWLTPICSAHLSYNVPTEYQIFWQINVSVALGIKGLMWFRYYDRTLSPNYHGSPIDAFGNPTERYYMMLRAQKMFHIHHGEIMMKLKHKKTFCLGKQFADYPMFEKDSHDLISMECYLDTIVSLFEDENGKEYLAVVNAALNESTCRPIRYDESKCSVKLIEFNGAKETPVASGAEELTFLFPGQMNLFRIDRI